MDITSMLIGTAAIGFGVFTFWARSNRPSVFKKLGPMKEKYGKTVGIIIHVISYSLIPIAFGAISILLGINGKSIF